MKRKLLLLLFILSMLPIYVSYAQTIYTYTANGKIWRYTLSGTPQTATIKGATNMDGTQASGALNIPNEVGNGPKYPVTTIGIRAFHAHYSITSLTIPPNVKTIEEGGFYKLLNLTGALSLPNVTTIGKEAFGDSPKITSLSAPNVITIADVAFTGDTGLTGILSLPKATTIGVRAFSSCQSLTGLSLPEVTAIGNNAFYRCEKVTGTLSLPKVMTIGNNAFYRCKKVTELSAPNVTVIGEAAFIGCESLTTISLPNVITIKKRAFSGIQTLMASLSLPKATTIVEEAFYGCTGITSLSAPQVTTIGKGAFRYCEKLTGTLSLPNVTTIGEEAFFQCQALTGLSLPQVTSIGKRAFCECKKLTGQLSLPYVTTIEQETFSECESLTGPLNLPNVTTVKQEAFRNCYSITGTLSLPNVTTIESRAFDHCEKITSLSLPKVTTIGSIGFLVCKSITGVLSLPNILTLGQAAFSGCTKITNLSIPKITTIGDNAFEYCHGLSGTLTIPASIKELGELAFGYTSNLEVLRIEPGASLTRLGNRIVGRHYKLKYIDMQGVTLPAGVKITRKGYNNGPFSELFSLTMVYLSTGSPAPEAGEENFVIGNTCDNFVVYDMEDRGLLEGSREGFYYSPYTFTANKATFRRNFANSFYSTVKTLLLPYPATLPDGMRAYTFEARTTHLGITHFRFTSVGDGGTQLEANKPYLVRIIDGSASKQFGTDVNVQVPVTPPIASTEVQDANGQGFYFGGTTENIDNATAAGMKAYNLINNQWRPIRTDNPNGYIHSFRAYMRTTGAAPAKGFAIVLDDEDTPTGIDDTVAEDAVEQGNSPIYTLDGKLMGTNIDTLPSGEIYIKNGKKFYKF